MHTHKFFTHIHTYKSLHTTYVHKIIVHEHVHNIFAGTHRQIINRNTQHTYQKNITHIHAHNIFARIHTQSIEYIHTINYDTHTCTQQYCRHTHTALNTNTPIFTYQKIIARIHAHDIFAHTHTHTNH